MSFNSEIEVKTEFEKVNNEIIRFFNDYHYNIQSVPYLEVYYRNYCEAIKTHNNDNAIFCIEKVMNILEELITQKSRVWSTIDSLDYNLCQQGVNICLKLLSVLKGIKEFAQNKFSKEDSIKKQIKELQIKSCRLREEKNPFLSLSLAITFIIMATIFIFTKDYFNSQWITYHICGFMWFIGFLIIKQDISMRVENKSFIVATEKINLHRAIMLFIQSILYMIPLAVLSYFFMENLFFRIVLFVQIWFCATLFTGGILTSIALSLDNGKNKSKSKNKIMEILLGLIAVASFVLQVLQVFKVI